MRIPHVELSNVIELGMKPNRHVDGMLHVNKDRVEVRKSENSYAKVITVCGGGTSIDFRRRQRQRHQLKIKSRRGVVNAAGWRY